MTLTNLQTLRDVSKREKKKKRREERREECISSNKILYGYLYWNRARFWCTNVTQEHRKYIDKNNIKNKEERTEIFTRQR